MSISVAVAPSLVSVQHCHTQIMKAPFMNKFLDFAGGFQNENAEDLSIHGTKDTVPMPTNAAQIKLRVYWE